MNLASISFPEDGKAAVQGLDGVIPLCKLLSDNVPAVREAASLALASLGQLKATKVTVSYYLGCLLMVVVRYWIIIIMIRSSACLMKSPRISFVTSSS